MQTIRRAHRNLVTNVSFLHTETLSHSKKLLHNPKGVKFGWSREVVGNCLPFTSGLISSRGRSLENIGAGYCVSQPAVPSPKHPAGQRRTDDSWLEMVLPFAEQTKLRESMMLDDGKTIRYGKLFELLDALAADVAYRHCGCGGGRSSELTIVTASVDGMKNFANIHIVDDIKMQGYITYAGTSSMEVTIDIIATREDGEDKLAETKYIMVARNGQAAGIIPGLLLANQEAIELFEKGEERARTRRARAQQSLSVSPPRPEEAHLIHNLYLQSIKQRRVRTDMSNYDQQVFSMLLQGELLLEKASTGEATKEGQEAATGTATSADLLNYYRNMKSENNSKWLRDTRYKSAQLMHVQNRNVHGKIFGGYIMKKAFEIANVAAVCFFGEQHPHFVFIDDIQFVRPMNVGSLAEFTSTVVYSHQGHIVVQVVVSTVDIVSGNKQKTNVLTYIFRTSVEDKPMQYEVIPKDYHEIVLYLEGKRALDKVFKDGHYIE